MARSLGLARVPTLDPKGEGDYPSYEYVRALVRALNNNFEILNSAYGGNRQDTTDLGTIYRNTLSSHNISVGFTVATNITVPPGRWLFQAKGNGVNTAGGVEYTMRLRDNTNGVTLDQVQMFAVDAFRIPYALAGTVFSPDDEVTVSVEDTSNASAGTMQNHFIVIWAYKIQGLG